MKTLIGFASIVVSFLFLTAAYVPAQSNTSLPVVILKATDPVAHWSGDPGAFTVLRDGPTNQSLSIFYRIFGSASNGVDYAELPGELMLAAGVRSNSILIKPVAKGQTTAKRVELALFQPPSFAPWNYRIGNPSNAAVTIFPEPPQVKIVSPTNGASFAKGQPVVICAQVMADATRYVATVEFFAGQISLGIRTNNPLLASPINPLCIAWSNAPTGEHKLTAKATDNQGTISTSEPVAIRVIETASTFVNITAPDAVAAETGPGSQGTNRPTDPAVFIVTRSGVTNIPLTVFYGVSGTARNGVDYRLLSGTVNFPAGASKAAIEIIPIDDQVVEPTESIVISLQPPICVAIFPPPPECYLLGPTNRAEAHILDNDTALTNQPPVVRITSPPAGAVFRSPVNIPVSAFARDVDGAVATVEFFAGTNSIGLGSQPPFGTNNSAMWSNTFVCTWSNAPVGTFALSAIATDDLGLLRRSEPVLIKVAPAEPPPTNRPIIITVAATDPVAIEGTNCWVRPVRTAPSATWSNWLAGTQWTLVTNCGPKNAAFAIHRHGATNDAVTVRYQMGGTATNGVDYVLLHGTAVIPAGSRNVIVPVVPIADEVLERNKTVVMRLLPPPESASGAYVLGYPRNAAVTIMDSMRLWPLAGLTPDHLFHLRASGPDGAWFRVDSSTNFVHWTPICTNQVVNGSIDFLDPDVSQETGRFYRAVPENSEPYE